MQGATYATSVYTSSAPPTGFKANRRNARLLEQHLRSPEAAARTDCCFLWTCFVLCVLLPTLLLAAVVVVAIVLIVLSATGRL